MMGRRGAGVEEEEEVNGLGERRMKNEERSMRN
jgi:hypothetical protein